MKRLLLLIVSFTLMLACTRQQASTPVTGSPPANDSLVRQVQHKDSSIMAYIKSINSIQGSVDTLMREAKILKKRGEPISDTGSLINELRMIGTQMLKNQQALVMLELKLKKSNESNDELVDMGENLSKELNERDSEIAVMQQQLVKTKATLNNLTKQFNDSLNIIMQERAQIGIMTTKGNSVYYIIGTEKELTDKGIIVNQGGVIGLGRVPLLNGNMDASGFTNADLTNLHEIILGRSFLKMVTPHPERSYKITHTSPDKLLITDPEDFWSKSKYMVLLVQ